MSNVSLKEWIVAARPKTLTAAIIPVCCGHLIVNRFSDFHVSVALTALALVCAVLIQIGTNFFNDVVDFKNGVDSERRLGPRRLLQLGKVSETRMRAAAHACFFSALLLGIPLILKGGLIILAIGLISIAIGYSYSAPPLKLAYRGLAEPFVVLFFGLIAVVGVEWLHTHSYTKLGIISGLQLGLLAAVLLVINNIRDADQDASQGKLTIVARFGRKAGIAEALFCYLLTLYLTFSAPLLILPLNFLSYLWLLPAVIVLQNLLYGTQGQALNKSLGFAALSHFLFGLGLCIRLLW